MGFGRRVNLEECSFVGFGITNQCCYIVRAQQCSGENTWGREPECLLALVKATWLREIIGTNGKSAIALEESLICSR